MSFSASHGGTDYKRGLAFLLSLEQWRGQGGFGVEKLRAVMSSLGDPQDSIPTIHIAGTNGKGSVSAAISAILGVAGGQVVLNTSPHLVQVNERICIDGLPIGDEPFGRVLERLRVESARLGINLTHFEAVTAAAFLICAELKVDWGVFEVGLGGRLDATNIIRSPKASAIVSIDFDHEAILGDTLAKIAVEKAGIIKDKTPVVIGKVSDEARWEIARIASDCAAPTLLLGRDFSVQLSDNGACRFSSKELGCFEFNPRLKGAHQVDNMAVAAALACVMGVDHQSIAEGIETVNWPARLAFHKVGERTVILDSAHNPAGAKSLISFLDSKGIGSVEVVFGAIGTKRWAEMVDTLRPKVSCWNILEPDAIDPVPSAEVVKYLSGFGINAQDCARNYAELLDIIALGDCDTPILVTGSMYLVGKVMATLSIGISPLWIRGRRSE
jgi:dihydrofolate synthase/folylpolyglutamate synthase